MPEIIYGIDGDLVSAKFKNSKDLLEIGFGKTKKEAEADLYKKVQKGFCTIFIKKNNRGIVTFNTIGEFTEDNARAYAINGGILGVIKPKDREELNKNIINFISNKLDEKKDKKIIKNIKALFEEFDEKYRILIGK